MLVIAGERPLRPTNRGILGLSEDVWMTMEKCWDSIPSTRPHAADALVLLETASHNWVPPASEAVANLSPPRPTSQGYFMAEPADTMPETVLETTGGDAVGPREAGQSPLKSSGEGGRGAATGSATVEGTFSLTSLTRFLVSIIPSFYKLVLHLWQGIRRVWPVGK